MEEKDINSSVPAEVSFPAYSLSYDMDLPLFADIEAVLHYVIAWLKEQTGIEIEMTGHFLCNVRTKEIIFEGTRLCDTAVLAGDRLIIF